MKLTKQQWLGSYKDKVSPRDYELLELAYDILEENTLYDPKYPWGDYRIISPWNNSYAGLWNWDTAFHAMAVSRYDTDLAKSCIEGFLQFQKENGLFPDVMYASGEIVDDISKPPVMPWAAMITYERCGDKEFLRRCYDRFVKNEAFLMRERYHDGLFFYSSQQDVEKDFYLHARWESGWDNSPRWDRPIVNYWTIDLNCFMVMMYRALSQMAQVLGEGQETADMWAGKANEVARLIEERMFNEEEGFYADVDKYTGEPSKVLTPAAFMPLYIGIATKERAEKMSLHAADEKKLYPGMPTVSYDDPTYSRDYWRGPTWLNVAYFAIKGLRDYGYAKLADEMTEFLLSVVYKNREIGIYENYDTKAQEGLFCQRFSWSCAFVIEFIVNKVE